MYHTLIRPLFHSLKSKVDNMGHQKTLFRCCEKHHPIHLNECSVFRLLWCELQGVLSMLRMVVEEKSWNCHKVTFQFFLIFSCLFPVLFWCLSLLSSLRSSPALLCFLPLWLSAPPWCVSSVPNYLCLPCVIDVLPAPFASWFSPLQQLFQYLLFCVTLLAFVLPCFWMLLCFSLALCGCLCWLISCVPNLPSVTMAFFGDFNCELWVMVVLLLWQKPCQKHHYY